MSQINACLSALPLLLLPFLPQPVYSQPGDAVEKRFQITYISLRGETFVLPADGIFQKKLVLTRSPKRKDILQAIRDHMVIDVPSQEVIDSMNEAYRRANGSEGKEQEFFVGRKGRISVIVQGTWDAVTPRENIPARMDLDAKGDEPAYDVHTHG